MKSAAIQSAVDEAGIPLHDIRGRAMITDVVMSSLALVSLLLLLLAVHSVRRLNFWAQEAGSCSSSHLNNLHTDTEALLENGTEEVPLPVRHLPLPRASLFLAPHHPRPANSCFLLFVRFFSAFQPPPSGVTPPSSRPRPLGRRRPRSARIQQALSGPSR